MTLSSQLATLESTGLIRLVQLQPEIEYLFRHALIQEAAYHSLVKSNRRSLHAAVGQALENLYPGRLDSPELAPVLARHFAEAGDQPRALRYYTLAGRAAAGMYASAEAIHHFGQALELAHSLKADDGVIVDLFLRRGHIFTLNAQDAEALENFEAMQAWAVAAGDRRAEVAAINARATIFVKPTVLQDLSRGYELSQTALALARELGDRPAEATALWNLLQYYLESWDLLAARANGEQALQITRAHGLRALTAYVLTDLFKVYFQLNQADQALAAVEEARTIWQELGVLNMLADNLGTTALINTVLGHYPQAVTASDEALRISRSIGNLWNQSYALYLLHMIHFDRGDIGQALETAEACLRLAEQAGFAEGINQTSFDLVLIYAYLGALPRAFEAVQRIRARAGVLATHALGASMVDCLLARLYLLEGRVAEAQTAFEQSPMFKDPGLLKRQYMLVHIFFTLVQTELNLANGSYAQALAVTEAIIPYMQQTGVRLFFADMLYLQGRALLATNRIEAAQSVFETTRAVAEALGARRNLWPTLAELAELAARRGDQAEAQALWQRAAAIVGYIAEHIGSAELAKSFVSQPAVRAVLEQAGATPSRAP